MINDYMVHCLRNVSEKSPYCIQNMPRESCTVSRMYLSKALYCIQIYLERKTYDIQSVD